MLHIAYMRRGDFRRAAFFPLGLAACLSLWTGCGQSALDTGFAPDEMVMFGETSRIRTLDPIRAGDVPSGLAVGKIYETLLEYHYLDRPYRVIPALAADLPTISEDGLVYTFRIRSGIYFQDDPCFVATQGRGRELTAHDFVYSIKRVADIKNASTGYWAFNDRIAGLDEFRAASGDDAPTDYDQDVPGLRALDRYTLQLTLKRPYPQMLWILAMHYAAAVPREAVEFYGDDFRRHPVGTGPFILESWRPNYRIEFVRNPKWAETGRIERYPDSGAPGDEAAGLLADAGAALPFIDRMVFYVIGDTSTQWLMFLRGQFELSGISRDNWDAVLTDDQHLATQLAERGIMMDVSPTLNLAYYGFNMEDPVVGQSDNPEQDRRNRLLRQAMTSALNTPDWERFYNYRIRRPAGPIPPGVAGYVPRESPFPFDLDRARALLAEAGYPDGIDPATGRRLQIQLELGSADNAEIRQATELFADFMDQIGIVIVPGFNNWPTFLSKIQRGQAQMFGLSWVADYPDAENFLQLFYSPNRPPGPNRTRYRNPAFDRLYEQTRVMQDSPERTELYQEMATLVMEDCPWIFHGQPMAYGLYQGWLRNYKRHDFPYSMSKYHRIDLEARRQWQAAYGR
jgi:oligopeptide transport system substrate-binding protein